MKKHVIIFLLLLLVGANLNLLYSSQPVQAEEPVVIPDEAIRLRILANSDDENDQRVKRLIRDQVNIEITKWVQDLTSIEEARKVIKSHLPEIQAIAERVLKEQQVKQSVHVKFGTVRFPTKLYGQFLYPAGKYEAILVTLGEGEGANWWCVLFPPLCFLDFSNGAAVQDPSGEYKPSNVKDDAHPSESTATEASDGADVNQPKTEEDVQQPEEKEVEKPVKHKVKKTSFVDTKEPEEQKEVKVKFFVVEWVSKMWP
ncbi:stage II sporulation protein R [Priestia koreensis]|uniref:stage II sporulation protein R n=1 Tax=Priestia koreensis TaxID=284581 RepID=UPI00203B8015|nr:stage II sporulation protein R [Priestia koreensis]MCM3006583.1 stage II sporulation protein R [Priestia koreensis]